MAWIRLPGRRRLLLGLGIAVLVFCAGYFPVFWNSSGAIAAPAHALHSQFSPDIRDANSNDYRTIENQNLGLDIKSSPVLGQGFGLPIEKPIPIIDLTNIDPSIRFIPHNGILYVWMRMGTLGALAFWWVIGCATIAASRLARVADLDLALFGAFAVCALSAYLIEGWYDMGLTAFRVQIFIACVLGCIEAAPAIAVAVPAPARRLAPGATRLAVRAGAPRLLRPVPERLGP